MKKLFYYLFATVLCCGFVACDTEENNENEVENEWNENEIPDDNEDSESDDTSNAICVLASVVSESRLPSGTTTTTKIFESPIYEVNKWNSQTVLKSYENEGSSYSFVYDLPNKVFYYPPYYDVECILSAGLISEVKIGGESHTFEYDNKRRLISRTLQYGSEIQVEEFTYDGKFNMVGYKRTRNDEILYEAEIEYTKTPAKTIPLQCLDSSFGNVFNDVFSGWSFLEMGLYGNTIPLYLIERILYKSSGEEVEKVFEYSLNRTGYVVEMVEMDYRSSGTFITTYTFDWEAVSVPTYTNWLFLDIASPYYRYL